MSEPAACFELADTALISFSGEDAVSFLHAQLTSDVAGLPALATQYSGYCSPTGRLLATFLLWRLENEILVALPVSLRESIQTRIARYVLRAKVKVADATSRYALFGIAGGEAASTLQRLLGCAVPLLHQVAAAHESYVATIPQARHLVLVPADASETRTRIETAFVRRTTDEWCSLDIAAGIAILGAASQEEYVPQMVNLDLLGGVSFSKGCYPGQEIVARTHYLGRLKQRMYRVGLRGSTELRPGQSLYSAAFGPEQASGAVVYASGGEALAVIQKASVEAADLHLGALDGPRLEILPLPYSFPD